VKAIASAIARLFSRRGKVRAIGVVDQLPLFGGAVVHVVDVDGRRLVFAATPNAIRLLAEYASPKRDHHPAGAASRIV
jgi:flagellar biogenesis protein FliO